MSFELVREAIPLTESFALFESIPFIKTNKRVEYANVPAAFDIEASSFYVKYDKCACMYAWVFGVNGKCVIGRTWDEFIDVLDQAKNALGLNVNRRLIVYVHNLAYEFQFIQKKFAWHKIFATEQRKPIYALTEDGIEFRCSLRLSGFSLEKVGEHLLKYPVQKMVGDLDYSLLRHSKTPLTDKEIGYILNDGLVVMAYIKEEMEMRGDRIDRVPLTKTGKVRKLSRDYCLYDGSHKNNQRKYYRYMDLMRALTMTLPEYKENVAAFQGGFTHGGNVWSTILAKDVGSKDFTSSYPTVMVAEKFPMGKGQRIRIESREHFERQVDLYCCIFEASFEGLEATFPYDHYLSSSKCRKKKNERLDNGRIVSADYLETTITSVDYEIIKRVYRWKRMKVRNFIRYPKGYLPKDFVHAILDLYRQKTELKGVEGKEAEYQNAKELINSCYGMTVTAIVREEITFERGQWGTGEGDPEKQLKQYNESRQRFLFYAWGVFVTAYARRNLWSGILECGPDYIYSDTDSIKAVHMDKHEDYFRRYNESITRKLEKAMDVHGFPHEWIRPKTVEGVEKPLGVWDDEGVYTLFKTLGAKRYMTYKDGKLSLTVSGVNKKTAVPYLLWKYKTVDECFKRFDDKLIIPATYEPHKGEVLQAAGKNTHTYIDEPRKGVLCDYMGIVGEYEEDSSVHLEPTSYDLSMSDLYINYLRGVRDSEF